MQSNAIIEEQVHSDERRGDARWRIRLEVTGSLDQEQANVVIHDISTAGMLIETDCDLTVGQSIAVSLPQAETITAQIVWRSAPLFGCRFETPLAQASLSAVRLRSPGPQISGPVEEGRPAAAAAPAPEKLSDRLRRLRRERGMTRTALSDRTGISKTTIWAWETGKTMPRHSNILTLAEVFGLTDQQLLMGEAVGPAQHGQEVGTDMEAPSLSILVARARDAIAQAAGVDGSKVHIRIAF